MSQIVKFDDRTWGRLASMADDQGMSIQELLEGAAHRLIVGTSRSPRPRSAEDLSRTRAAHMAALTERVLRLRQSGKTVAYIADATGYSTTYVSKILCANGARTWTRNAQSGQEEGQAA